jgi:hypothetical protein
MLGLRWGEIGLDDADDAAAGGWTGDDVDGVDFGEAFDDLAAGGGLRLVDAAVGVDGEAADLGGAFGFSEEREEPVGAGEEMELGSKVGGGVGGSDGADVAIVADDVADRSLGEVGTMVVVGEGDGALEEGRGPSEHVGRVEVAHPGEA